MIPDRTLGNENSVVLPNQNIRGIPSERIDGGAVRGGNLFHSFQEFNIDEGRGVYFSNPDSIINILTRVTGENISNILGTLGVLGNANLFFINPNGIVFGPNARLDVGGSFFASTADGILFENGVEFAASNSESPPLLTINIPLGLNVRENPGRIVNQSVALNQNTGVPVGLQVSDGETLGFVGGEIQFEGGRATARGGRIEFGSVAQGQVGIERPVVNETEESLRLAFPPGVTRSDVTFTAGASADVVGDDGGSIAINARNVEFQASNLFAGIAENSGSVDSQAGNIEINATENVNLTLGSRIFNDVQAGAVGQAGDVRITTQNLSIAEGSQLSASTLGEGNAGSVIINAQNQVSFEGNIDGTPSGAFSRVEESGQGEGGNVEITTNQLSVSNGAQISGSTFGEGDAGNVVIEANQVEVAGENSGIFSQVLNTGEGRGGNVRINTRRLSVSEGGTLATNTFNLGNAGNVQVNATEAVSLSGNGSSISSSVRENAQGNGGDINLITGSLSVSEGASLEATAESRIASLDNSEIGNAGNIQVTAATTASFSGVGSGAFSTLEPGAIGKAGNVEINAGSIFITEGAELSSSTSGRGDAGNVTLNADNFISLNSLGSGVFSTVEPGAVGNSGTVRINTDGSLRVTNGATVESAVKSDPNLTIGTGQGNAGNVEINATNSVLFDGDGTRASSALETGGVGRGGNITINAGDESNPGSVAVRNGATLQAQTQGVGDAGNITINAPNGFVSFSGSTRDGANPSAAFSTVEAGAEGRGGNLRITTGNLSVSNGGQLQTVIRGVGNAGRIEIEASDRVVFDSSTDQLLSGAFSTVEAGAEGQAGNIGVNAGTLSVSNGAQLQTLTRGVGDAGSIIINAPNGSVSFSGTDRNGSPSGAFSTVEEQAIGNSGGITIQAGSLDVQEGARLESLVRQRVFFPSFPPPRQGNAGDIRIEVSGNTSFDGVNPIIPVVDEFTNESNSSGAFSQIEAGIEGEGGNIEIKTGNLFVTNGAQLQAQMEGIGDGGNIVIDAQDGILFDGVDDNGQPSRAITVVATLAEGNGGNIDISGRNLSVTNGAQLDASVNQGGIGNAGDIIINVDENAFFDGTGNGNPSGAFTTLEQQAFGFAGEINITAANLAVTNGAQLQALTRGIGNTGDIVLNARNAFFDGTGENNLQSGVFTTVELGAFSLEILGLQEPGNSGDIVLSADNIFISNGAQIQTRTSSIGNAGDIFISTGNLSMTNRGQLEAQTDGIGDAGDIFVNALNNISIDDSEAFTTVGIISLPDEPFFPAIGNGGNINITTGNLFITNGGQLQAQTLGIGDAGSITVNTREGVFVDETDGSIDQFPSAAFTLVGFSGVGIGGDINITTENLSITNGAELRAETNGQGNAGNIVINARDRVFFGNQAELRTQTQRIGNAGNVIINAEGDISFENSDIFATVEATAVQNSQGQNSQGGEVRITAENLSVTNGSQLQTVTRGAGDAGKIIIETRDTVFFDGVFVDAENNQSFSSLAASTVEQRAVGEGGEISITAENLSITNGAGVATSTLGQGNAGTIKINTEDTVFLSGFGSIIDSSSLNTARGNGGNININTNQLSLLDLSVISASNFGTFENSAGNIQLETGDILFNISGLFTVTSSGNGGNIELEGRDTFLRNGSLIRTDAGLANAGGDGGNITIDNELLVGLESSHIAANAFLGRGGEITINADGVLGFQVLSRESLEERFGQENLLNFDPSVLSRSSITSISRTDPSLSGIVELNTEFDPDAASVDLPRNIVDPAALIDQNFCKQGRDSQFIIIGRGGLPPNPRDPQSVDLSRVEPIETVPSNRTQQLTISPQQLFETPPPSNDTEERTSENIIPARGWIRNEKGEVILVNYDPTQVGVRRQPYNFNPCPPQTP